MVEIIPTGSELISPSAVGETVQSAEPTLSAPKSVPLSERIGTTGSALAAPFARAAGPAYLVVIDGFEHGSFTDLPLFASAWPGEASGTHGRRAIEIQRAYVRAFFDRHLRLVSSPILQGNPESYPEASLRTRNTTDR